MHDPQAQGTGVLGGNGHEIYTNLPVAPSTALGLRRRRILYGEIRFAAPKCDLGPLRCPCAFCVSLRLHGALTSCGIVACASPPPPFD